MIHNPCISVCNMRQWSSFFYRWRYLIVVCALVYILILYLPKEPVYREKGQVSAGHGAAEEVPKEMPLGEKEGAPIIRGKRIKVEKEAATEWEYEFRPVGKEPFYITEVLTNFGINLKEKMTCKADKKAEPKIVLSLNAGHGQEHLGGCPDWNCQLSHDRSLLPKADAVLMAHDDPSFTQRPDQYVIYFSQESPKNSGFNVRQGLSPNMTLGFRHDSATASPYGYTVKLAKRSQPKGEIVNSTRIEGKKKGAAWFVSHCSTNSWRERIVEKTQKDFKIDVYGQCGPLKCARGGACEDMLDNDYFFYIAFENSICKDYITEKLWSQGYQREIVPVVLKRSLVEPFVPPNSFIAVDDYKSTEDFAAHLHYLTKNLTAYKEYFNWKREYRVIFLNGENHDVLERPWGFCQICRLMWEQPKKQYTIPDFYQYWGASCEDDGALASRFILNQPLSTT